MTPILPNRLDWPSAIGNFILNYGVLDWNLFVFLESRMPPDQFAKIKKEPFQDRIACVKHFVDDCYYSREQKQAFAKFFERLDSIRKLRNQIAHGHLLIRVTEDGKTPALTLSLPKDLDANYAAETRHFEFAELTTALQELTALIEEFQELSGGWHNETLTGSNP